MLRDVAVAVFDLDGTLVLADRAHAGFKALPGALEFIHTLAARQVPFVILTNGTLLPPAQIATRLRAIGFPVEDAQLVTPATVAAEYFVRRGLTRILVLGGEGVLEPLAAAGLEPSLPRDRRADIDAVFVGWFRAFGIDDLEVACAAVWAGAPVYTASLAPFYATAGGRAIGTSRAISAMITSLTGRRAIVLGKPALQALGVAASRTGVEPRRMAVVGDDPDLEVPMAHRAGALAIAVHTGVGSASAFAALPRPQRPHLSLGNMAELGRLYGAELPGRKRPRREPG